ncbi:hypothetical protein CIC46_10075 [Listeria monocytogenes]|nr:hypothetical protein [Listeria monocytogenes]
MFLLTACQAPQEEQATKAGYEVEQEAKGGTSLSFDQKEEQQETTNQSSITLKENATTSDSHQEEAKEVDVPLELLNKFGKAYANYRGLQDRNKQLLPLMSKQAAEENGIYVDDKNSGNALHSKGIVKHIYQPVEESKDEYAILLECIQNKVNVTILLSVTVKENQVTKMTYYTLKKEY